MLRALIFDVDGTLADTEPAHLAAFNQAFAEFGLDWSRAVGARWRNNFAVVGDASNAPSKKPHPQVYLNTLAALQLAPAACLAFEDSRNGLQAATAARLSTVITPTRYTAMHDFSDALRVVPDLGGVDVAQLQRWHREGLRAGSAANTGEQRSASQTPAQRAA